MSTLSRLVIAAAIALLAAAPPALADTIAVTEFFHHAIGEEEDGREWIELFNYGDRPVDIGNWTISDESNQSVVLPKHVIESGDFAIVVPGYSRGRDDDDRKAIFETEWLGGKSDPRVLGVSGRFSLSNAADEIQLRNNRRQPVWTLAYKNDGTPGRATFFAEDRFSAKFFGTKASPGVNRKGPDGRFENFLGYEGNNHTDDPEAYESDVAGLEEKFGILYQSAANGGQAKPGFGSPLRGHYSKAKK